MSNLEIRRITADETKPLRHSVLWPSIPVDDQLYPYDALPSTVHLGAFSPSHEPPLVGCLTLVQEPFTRPNSLKSPPPPAQVQLRKFAVDGKLQGQGIGRLLFQEAVKTCREVGEGQPVLLHLDAREEQVGFYQRLGMDVLDPEVFGKRGAGGLGPEIPHVRMGKVLQ